MTAKIEDYLFLIMPNFPFLDENFMRYFTFLYIIFISVRKNVSYNNLYKIIGLCIVSKMYTLSVKYLHLGVMLIIFMLIIQTYQVKN